MRDNERKRGVSGALLNLLFPARCPVCDDIVPAAEGDVCAGCRIKPRYIVEPRCARCGKQLEEDARLYCGDCAQHKHVFAYGYALYDYQSMRKSIYRFKYGGRCEYASFYARDIWERLRDEICLMKADSIIPVPVHASRMRSRGYNQAQLVAAELSKLTGIPIYDNVVRRVRKTLPQKELTAQERQNNLKKAFNISADVVKLNKTILVDDIYTTGSTLDAVALELKRHGVETVYFITLCIGEGL